MREIYVIQWHTIAFGYPLAAFNSIEDIEASIRAIYGDTLSSLTFDPILSCFSCVLPKFGEVRKHFVKKIAYHEEPIKNESNLLPADEGE